MLGRLGPLQRALLAGPRCRAEPVFQRVLGHAGLKMKEEEENFSYYFPGAILNAYFDEFE